MCDFPDRRLISIAPPTAYPARAALLGKRADFVREHCGKILRLMASLKAGYAARSAMLKKLAAYELQNHFDLAPQEVGKVERTLFMLTGSRLRP